MIRRNFLVADGRHIHYRSTGDGGIPLVMLHANPVSSRVLQPLMGELGKGRRVIAPDTPGFGDSDPLPEARPEIADFARHVGKGLDELGLGQFDVYGSHTGANLALELALTRPAQVRRVIFDGMAMYTDAEREELLASYTPEQEPQADGSHLLWAWHFLRDQAVFWPWFRRDAAHRRDVDVPSPRSLQASVLDVLKALETYHLGYRASFRYEKPPRLPGLSQPVLVATSVSDIFHDRLRKVAALIPNAEAADLPPYRDPDYTAKAAAVFDRFLAQ